MKVLGVFDASQRAPRRETRLIGAQAAAAEVVFEDREMRGDFPREIRFRRVASKDVEKP
jgi:hypothetical protein